MKILPDSEIDFCEVNVGRHQYFQGCGHLWQCLGCRMWYMGSTGTGQAHTKDGHGLYRGCCIDGGALVGEVIGIRARTLKEAFRKFQQRHEERMHRMRTLQVEMRTLSDEELAAQLPPEGTTYDDQTERQRYAESERIVRRVRRGREAAASAGVAS